MKKLFFKIQKPLLLKGAAFDSCAMLFLSLPAKRSAKKHPDQVRNQNHCICLPVQHRPGSVQQHQVIQKKENSKSSTTDQTIPNKFFPKSCFDTITFFLHHFSLKNEFAGQQKFSTNFCQTVEIQTVFPITQPLLVFRIQSAGMPERKWKVNQQRCAKENGENALPPSQFILVFCHCFCSFLFFCH